MSQVEEHPSLCENDVALTERQFEVMRQIIKCARIVDACGGLDKAMWEAPATLHSLILNYPIVGEDQK